MDKIEIKYTNAYIGEGEPKPSIALGAGLPQDLKEAENEYEAMITAMDAFIKKVNSMPNKEVVVEGGLELHVK